MRTIERNPGNGVATLENRKVQGINQRGPLQVQVISGTAYITKEGDERDYVLESGESVVIDRKGRIVVQGMPYTQYRVIAK